MTVYRWVKFLRRTIFDGSKCVIRNVEPSEIFVAWSLFFDSYVLIIVEGSIYFPRIDFLMLDKAHCIPYIALVAAAFKCKQRLELQVSTFSVSVWKLLSVQI